MGERKPIIETLGLFLAGTAITIAPFAIVYHFGKKAGENKCLKSR